MSKRIVNLIILGVVVLLLLLLSASVFATVPEGYIGVKYQFGKIVSDNLQPGINFKIPFIQEIRPVDVREQSYELKTPAYTKDSQTLENVLVRLNYAYSKDKLSDIIRNIGIDKVESKIIVPRVNASLKNATGQYKAEEIIQNRSQLMQNVESALRDSLLEDGILVMSFNILDIEFESSFEEVVRSKVEAEQDALKAKNVTLQKEEAGKQKVIEAQADADSRKLEADAKAYAIEAEAKAEALAMELIQKQLAVSDLFIEYIKWNAWDGKFPVIMGNDVNPFVNIGSIDDIGK